MAPRILIFAVFHCLRELNIRRVGKAECIFSSLGGEVTSPLTSTSDSIEKCSGEFSWSGSIQLTVRTGGWVNLRLTLKDRVLRTSTPRRIWRNKRQAIKKEKGRRQVKPKERYCVLISRNHECVYLWWRQVNGEGPWQTYESSKTITMQPEICSQPGDIAYLLQQLPSLETKSISIKTQPGKDAPPPSPGVNDERR